MNEMIATAIASMLLAAGAPKDEIHLVCHKETVSFVRGGKRYPVTVKACQVYVSKDGLCQAIYDHAKGFWVWCKPSGRDTLVERL